MTILQKHLVFIPLFFVIFAGLLGGLVMVLWNWLMPYQRMWYVKSDGKRLTLMMVDL